MKPFIVTFGFCIFAAQLIFSQHQELNKII